jgi:hypothetical protein
LRLSGIEARYTKNERRKDEQQAILDFHNGDAMRALLVRRENS